MQHPAKRQGDIGIPCAGGQERGFRLLLAEQMIIFLGVGRGKDAQDAPAGIPGEIAVHHIRKDEGRLVLPDSSREPSRI